MDHMHTCKSTPSGIESPCSTGSNLSHKIEVLDHGSLIVLGGTPDSSSQSSPSNSRPTSARLRGSSAPSRASRPSSASSHKSNITPALDKQEVQRLEIHQKRKERCYRNIFSDSIIERELGKFAEANLKDDFAQAFRQHIQKVGGRFSRYSFRRTAVSPDRVVPVISDLPLPRPSFSPLNTHSSIIGLQPESSQDDITEPEIIEPLSLLRAAARSVDIKSISLHSGTKRQTPSASDVQRMRATQRPSSASSHIVSVDALDKESQYLPVSPSLQNFRPVSFPDAAHPSSGLFLSGGGLCRRTIEMSGQGKTSRSAYITAVHNGVFQTSAPFSFRAGDKVTFSGAHVPPQIVLGNAYTILNTAPLSFKLADTDSNGWNIEDNVAIFQARVWEGDVSNNVKAAVQSNEPMSASSTKDSQSKTAASDPLLSNRSLAPTVYASSLSSVPSNAVLKHVARCSSGQRRSSRFTTHISPLKRNDAHDSVRSMNSSMQTPTSSWKKAPAYLSSSTRTSQHPPHAMSSSNAYREYLLKNQSTAHHKISPSPNLATMSPTSLHHPRPKSAFNTTTTCALKSNDDLEMQAAVQDLQPHSVLLKISSPIALSLPQRRAGSAMSSRLTSSAECDTLSFIRDHHHNNSALLSSREELSVRSPPVHDAPGTLEEYALNRTAPLYCSPQFRPQHDESYVPSLSLSGVFSRPKAVTHPPVTSSPLPTLIQGKSIGEKNDRSSKNEKSVVALPCRGPEICRETPHQTTTAEQSCIVAEDSSPAIIISGKSLLKNDSPPAIVPLSSDKLVLASSDEVLNVISGSYSIVPRAFLSPSIPDVPAISIAPCCPSVKSTFTPSTCARTETMNVSDNDSVTNADISKSKSHNNCGHVTDTALEPATLSVVGYGQSLPFLSCQKISSPSLVLNSNRDHALVSALKVPMTTPRIETPTPVSVELHVEHQSVKESNCPNLFSEHAIGSKGLFTSHAKMSKISLLSRSKLLLQSPSCLHPTLMPVDEKRCYLNHSCSQSEDASNCGPPETSLPWFINDNSSKSVLHSSHGTSYMKRQSGIAVSSAKSTLQKAVPSKVSVSDAQTIVCLRLPNAAKIPTQEDMDVSEFGPNSSNAIPSSEVELRPVLVCKTGLVSASQCDSDHLKLLASSRVHQSRDRHIEEKTASNQHALHHHETIIIPKVQTLYARLERDSATFNHRSLPLHFKGLQRNERRHQRVILGADALRAQKLDI